MDGYRTEIKLTQRHCTQYIAGNISERVMCIILWILERVDHGRIRVRGRAQRKTSKHHDDCESVVEHSGPAKMKYLSVAFVASCSNF
jgi:hypothetical protein